MKLNLKKLGIYLLLCFPMALSSQITIPLLSDDFSNPSFWQNMGTKTYTWGAPGNLSITGGVANWDNFRGRQTYRLNRPLNGALTDQNRWRMELEFTLNTAQNLVGAFLMAITENNLHPQSNASASYTYNQNDGISLLIANPLNTSSPGNDHIRIYYKIGSSLASSPEIQIQRNVLYYVRLERLNHQDLALSVYTDPLRTVHAPGSPVCVQMDPGMREFNYLQMSSGTTSSQYRINTITSDNLAIYDNVFNLSCLTNEGCNINADVQYTTDGGCFFQFVNNSSAGPGNTLFNYSIIDFGDGTSAQVAPGDIVSHTYASGGTYQVCITTKGYDAMLECCEDRVCIEVEANCDSQWEVRKKREQPETPVQLDVFPNPSSGQVRVRSEETILQLQIFNINGQQVFEQKCNQTDVQLNILSLGSGIYFLEAELESNHQIRRKISIQ